jgi:hypothetical protein
MTPLSLAALSKELFGALRDGSMPALLALVGCVLGSAWTAERAMIRVIRLQMSGERTVSFGFISMIGRGDIARWVRYELLMLLRTPRLRQGTIVSLILLAVVFTGGLVLIQIEPMPNRPQYIGMALAFALPALPASLAFATEGFHFDGLLARPISLENMVRGRLCTLQALAVIPTIIASTFFWMWEKALAAPTIASGVLCAGFLIPLVVYNATRNTEPVSLNKSGLLNYDGLSIRAQTRLFIGIVVMISVLDNVSVRSFTVGALILGGVGVLATQLWAKLICTGVVKRRYRMAHEFRASRS